MTIPRIRQYVLLLAESFDAWRVIPRLMLLAYGYLVFNLYIWYKNIPTYVQEKCDANIVMQLLAEGMSKPEIKQFACTVGDVVGGPTAAQSTFVTTIIGLSTGIFGLYTATGRKWDNWEPPAVHRPQVSYEPQVVAPDMGMETVGPTPKASIQIYGETAPEDDSPKP